MENNVHINQIINILTNTPSDDDIRDLTKEEVDEIRDVKEDIAISFLYALQPTSIKEVKHFLRECGCKEYSVEKAIEEHFDGLQAG